MIGFSNPAPVFRFLLGSLSVGVFAAAVGCSGLQPTVSGTSENALAIFSDRSEDAGLDFVHFNGMSGALYILEVMGSGAGLLDYDNDGDLDAYVVQGHMLGPGKTVDDAVFPPAPGTVLTDRLFRNDLEVLADGTRRLRFTDVTEASRIRAGGYGMGVATGDYDNDGWTDLYVTNFGSNELWRNNGDGTFSDVTARAGVDDPRWSVPAAFVDYDGDGWLDLWVGNYVDFTIATHKRCYYPSGLEVHCGPLSYDAVPDRLYRNRGDGTFEDVTRKAGLDRAYGRALGVIPAELSGDGRIDLYVANDASENLLWVNRGDGTFVDEALLSGCAVNAEGEPESSMGVDAGDFDGDGDEDLFMTHLNAQTNTLYRNEGGGIFRDVTTVSGLGESSLPYTSFGTAWFDYDNDSLLDLVAVSGEIMAIEAMARAGDPYPLRQPKLLFRNLGGGRFEDATGRAGAIFGVPEVSRGAAFGDVDNDGDIDILVSNNSGPARLLVNEVGQNRHWLGLRLLTRVGTRDAIGAWVEIRLPGGGTLGRRLRTAGSYASASDPRVLVGADDETGPFRVRVRWPTGRVEEFSDLPADRYSTLTEKAGESVGAGG